MLNAGLGPDRSFLVRLYVSDISMSEEFYDGWYDRMPKERQKRADRFKHDADRHRLIGAYALLVHAMTELFEGEDLSGRFNISETSDGKPYFTDIPVCFNISHSMDRIAVALSPKEVGCDVEVKSGNVLTVAKRFFTPEEYVYLQSIEDEEERSGEFTRIWTMKESVVKCSGEGIRHRFDDFSCVDEKGIAKGEITLAGKDSGYHIKEYESENGYRYSVCSMHDRFEDSIRRITLK